MRNRGRKAARQLILAAAGAAATLGCGGAASGEYLFHNYDALGRLTRTCHVTAIGQKMYYNYDQADNRSAAGDFQTTATLVPNSGFASPDGRFLFWMQPDGNLVQYQQVSPGNYVSLWATNTVGSGAIVASFQTDGNLVLYNSAAGVVWASNSAPNWCATLNILNSGDVTIVSADGATVWHTGTGGN